MQPRSLKYTILVSWHILTTFICFVQPAGYYDSTAGLTGTELQQTFHDIIHNHTVVTYSSLWIHFQSTDKKADGSVWDMYSDNPSGTPAYTYTFITDQCGSDNGSEGYCYNREHSFPKSWFGGETDPMHTDLFHIYPTDYYVNNQRGGYPYGVTDNPAWSSTNGSRLGPCSYAGYTGIVFEPINSYKGDLARTYFYMAVKYYGEDSSWPGSDMVTGSQLKPWALQMMIGWDQADPVSQKERDHNEAVYAIQGNRNPFIDNSSYASLIWDTQSYTSDISNEQRHIKIWPNPAGETVTLELPSSFPDRYMIRVSDLSGKTILEKTVLGKPIDIDVTSLGDGFYIIIISGSSGLLSAPLVISH